MKTSTFIFALFAIATTAFAGSPLSTTQKVDWQKAEINYLHALNSDNIGVRQSAASHLGVYKLKGAVQQLITVLQTDKSESSRMIVALALVKIGEQEGVAAVEEASYYDGSEKVAKFCERILKELPAQHDLSLK